MKEEVLFLLTVLAWLEGCGDRDQGLSGEKDKDARRFDTPFSSRPSNSLSEGTIGLFDDRIESGRMP